MASAKHRSSRRLARHSPMDERPGDRRGRRCRRHRGTAWLPKPAQPGRFARQPVGDEASGRATYTNELSGLELLAIPNYQQRLANRAGRHPQAFSILRNHYSVVLMDCCKVLKSAVTEAVLLESRALVVVTNASVDAIRKTRTTIEWLSRNGYHRQLESTVLAINHTEQESRRRRGDRLQRASTSSTPNVW